MTPETQQKILKVNVQLFTELDYWLKRLGLSRAQIIPLYVSVLKENGMMANFVTDLTADVLPSGTKVAVNPETIVEELHRAESGEFAAWLLKQPEPSPDELNSLLKQMKDALANLRQHFLHAAKSGPRHKHGGRPKELDDPEIHERIRAKIRDLRGHNTTLKDIFRRLAREHGVSPSKIKRIWEEELREKGADKPTTT
jgi:hypothetical protein